jgi:acyl carrier protein phosphodiesterase
LNHLAHFLLAPRDAQSVAGTLLADFHRGPIAPPLPDAVRSAIALHRAIDGATDRMRPIGELKASFRPGARRYAGLALDLYFDHCLVRRWDGWAATPLDAFVDATYRALDGEMDAAYVPHRMRLFARAMRDHDWLRSYRSFDGVEAALGRLQQVFRRRFGREVDLAPAAAELGRLAVECDAAFDTLFPALQHIAHSAPHPPVAACAGVPD